MQYLVKAGNDKPLWKYITGWRWPAPLLLSLVIGR